MRSSCFFPQGFWIILLAFQELLEEAEKTPLNHPTFNSPIYYIWPFPLCPEQINLFLFFSFYFFAYFLTSFILHTMDFYHNIGWGAPHLLKCHHYQLCTWWLPRGNNIAFFPFLFFFLSSLYSFTFSHFLARKRAVCSKTGTCEQKPKKLWNKERPESWMSHSELLQKKKLFSSLKKMLPGEVTGWRKKKKDCFFLCVFCVCVSVWTVFNFIHRVFIRQWIKKFQKSTVSTHV